MSLKTIDIITKLRSDGSAPRLIVQGLLSTKAVIFHDIAVRFNEYAKQSRKYSKAASITMVASEFKVSERTVYRALHMMEVCNDLPEDV